MAEAKEETEDEGRRASGRSRATVERWAPKEKAARADPVEAYVAGEGEALGAIPNVEFMLRKLRGDHDLITALHMLVYKNKKGAQKDRKANLRKFSGFEFEKGSDAWAKAEAKLSGPKPWTTACLKDLCRLLDVKIGKGNSGQPKEALVDAIMAFLAKPKKSGQSLHSVKYDKKARGTKRKKSGKKNKKKGTGLKTPYILFAIENRASVKEKNPDADPKEIIKLLGAKWSSCSDAEKQPYKDQYAASKSAEKAEESSEASPAKKAKREGDAKDENGDEDEEE